MLDWSEVTSGCRLLLFHSGIICVWTGHQVCPFPPFRVSTPVSSVTWATAPRWPACAGLRMTPPCWRWVGLTPPWWSGRGSEGAGSAERARRPCVGTTDRPWTARSRTTTSRRTEVGVSVFLFVPTPAPDESTWNQTAPPGKRQYQKVPQNHVNVEETNTPSGCDDYDGSKAGNQLRLLQSEKIHRGVVNKHQDFNRGGRCLLPVLMNLVFLIVNTAAFFIFIIVTMTTTVP